MRNKTILLLLPLMGTSAWGASGVPSGTRSSAAGEARAGQTTAAAPTTRIWTNSDLDKMKDQDLISLVGPEPTATPATATPIRASASPSGETAASDDIDRTDDMERHDIAETIRQADKLETELETEYALLVQREDGLEEARSFRETQPGMNLDEGNIGITPEAGIDILELRMRDIENQLDALTGSMR